MKVLNLRVWVPVLLSGGLLGSFPAHATLDWGYGANSALNYAVLVNGGIQTLQMSGSAVVTGNVGVGLPTSGASGHAAQVSLAGGTITGNLQWAGTYNSGGQANNSAPNFGGTVKGGYQQNVSAVTSALNTVDALSAALGKDSGTAVAINPNHGTQTITANKGVYDSSQNSYVFTVTSLNFNSGDTLVINGTAAQNVVINVHLQNDEFNGAIQLTGGLTTDDVMINLLGNNEFQNAANGATQTVTYVDPAGTDIDINSPLDGHFFGSAANTPVSINYDVDDPIIPGDLTVVPEASPGLACAFLLLPLGVALCRSTRAGVTV